MSDKRGLVKTGVEKDLKISFYSVCGQHILIIVILILVILGNTATANAKLLLKFEGLSTSLICAFYSEQKAPGDFLAFPVTGLEMDINLLCKFSDYCRLRIGYGYIDGEMYTGDVDMNTVAVKINPITSTILFNYKRSENFNTVKYIGIGLGYYPTEIVDEEIMWSYLGYTRKRNVYSTASFGTHFVWGFETHLFPVITFSGEMGVRYVAIEFNKQHVSLNGPFLKLLLGYHWR